MWKLEREEDYFRIYDSNKDIAGYFDPDFGELFPKEKEEELIEQMHKNHDKIPGGFLILPMLKFGIFGNETEMDINQLQSTLDSVKERLDKWRIFISESGNDLHFIQVSHTDQDMLSITFPMRFKNPIPLEKNSILHELGSILDSLQRQGLL
jgi:hypothetical protein